jgi:hypothetical protein
MRVSIPASDGGKGASDLHQGANAASGIDATEFSHSPREEGAEAPKLEKPTSMQTSVTE